MTMRILSTLKLIVLIVLVTGQYCDGLAVGRRSFLSKVATVTTLTVGGTAITSQATYAATKTDEAVTKILSTNEQPLTDTKAPYFELPNSRDSGEISLNQLVQNGKWTVLYFYPGAFTQGMI